MYTLEVALVDIVLIHILHLADTVHDHHLVDDILVEDDEVEDEVEDGRDVVFY